LLFVLFVLLLLLLLLFVALPLLITDEFVDTDDAFDGGEFSEKNSMNSGLKNREILFVVFFSVLDLKCKITHSH